MLATKLMLKGLSNGKVGVQEIRIPCRKVSGMSLVESCDGEVRGMGSEDAGLCSIPAQSHNRFL